MIRIQSNGSVVKPNNANLRVTGNNVDLQTEARSLGQLAQGLGELRSADLKAKKESDDQKRLAALNELERQNTELLAEVETKKRMGNAEGAAVFYRTEYQKIYNKVLQNSGIRYQSTQDLFTLQADRANISDLDRVYRFENSQIQENKKVQRANWANQTINRSVQNLDVDDLKIGMQQLELESDSIRLTDGDDVASAYLREYGTQLASTFSQYALLKGKPEIAQQGIDALTPYVDMKDILPIVAKINEIQLEDDMESLTDQIGERSGYDISYEEFVSQAQNYQTNHYVPAQDRSSEFDSGEGTFWTKQNPSTVQVSNLTPQAKTQAVNISDALKKNGLQMVITSGTDGTSHVQGTYSHYNGWKIDIESYKWTSEQKQKAVEIINSTGAKANLESEGTDNEHIDIVLSGGATKAQGRNFSQAELRRGHDKLIAKGNAKRAEQNRRNEDTRKAWQNDIYKGFVALGDDPTIEQRTAAHKDWTRKIMASDLPAEVATPLLGSLSGYFGVSEKEVKNRQNTPEAMENKLASEQTLSLGNLGLKDEKAASDFIITQGYVGADYARMMKIWHDANDSGTPAVIDSALSRKGYQKNTPQGKIMQDEYSREDARYTLEYRNSHSREPSKEERINNLVEKSAQIAIIPSNFGFGGISANDFELKAMGYKRVYGTEDGKVSVIMIDGTEEGTHKIIDREEFVERLKRVKGGK